MQSAFTTDCIFLLFGLCDEACSAGLSDCNQFAGESWENL